MTAAVRAVPAGLDQRVVAGIDAHLDDLQSRESVRMLWAVESGSRAWGFPSPDSDYDCRFIYARAPEAYLGPWVPRDVLEIPIDPVYDLNGWDLVKAVRLLLKGNATVGEWLRSPIVYRGDRAFQQAFVALADEVFDLDRARAHYLHVGRLQWPDDPETGKLKRRMYTLRAAASLRWLRVNGPAVPPMDLPTLAARGDLGDDLRRQIDELIALKAQSREADAGSLSPDLTRFVLEEFEAAEAAIEHQDERRDLEHAKAAATSFFTTWIRPEAGSEWMERS